MSEIAIPLPTQYIVLEKSWLPYLEVLYSQCNVRKQQKWSLLQDYPRPLEHHSRCTLRTLTQGHLRLLEIFLLCQDPGGRCCHDLVVPDDLSLLHRGQLNSPLLVPRPCPFSASQVTWEVALILVLGDSPRGSLERSTVLSSQDHQPLQQPPVTLEVQLLSPPLLSLLSHHNVSRSGSLVPSQRDTP